MMKRIRKKIAQVSLAVFLLSLPVIIVSLDSPELRSQIQADTGILGSIARLVIAESIA